MCFFKIILLFVGYAIADWQGAFLGVLIGWLLDRLIFPNRTKFTSKRHYGKDDFVQIMLILTSAVVKSSKEKIVKSELYFVKDYLIRNLDPDNAQKALYLFGDIMDREYDIENICRDVGSKASVSEKLFILQFLMGLSGVDGHFHEQELEMVRRITAWLGLPSATFESVRIMFMGSRQQQQWTGSNSYENRGSTYGGNSYSGGYSGTTRSVYSNLDNDYKILEVSPDASDAELKKAYRAAAMKHHPDKVSHLGEDIRKVAEEKFAKVNQAYERIKKARGSKF